MSEPFIHSHWHQSISGLSVVPSEFYEAVAQAIQRKNIAGVHISGTYFSEGAIGSAQRLYLRAKRNEYYFDICGAPFADGSFVSWWLVEDAGCMRGCLLGIPYLGALLMLLFFRDTYYRVDTRLMFQEAIHSAVLEVVDAMTTAKGIRALSDTQRTPTLNKILK
ncbi:MAG TPA: hypothetical protein VJ276_10710 [Thermoanaerobaculia bacterium]|nr:hypothetical protein [Thermoanaerobaculia bacterium]